MRRVRRENHIRFLTHVDVLDVEIAMGGACMTGFSINDRAFIRDAWTFVARYDTTHGRLHLHRQWSARRIVHLERPGDAPADGTSQFERCLADMNAKWRAMRAHMESGA